MGSKKRLSLGNSKKILKKPSGPKPDLSVVVIALNEEERIAQCIESLRSQEFGGSLEIILADGNSFDRTVEVAKPLVDGIIVEKCRNCAFERNAGSLIARAPIIAFADSDSIIGKNWAKEIMKTFIDSKQTIAVFGVSGVHDAGKLERKLSRSLMASYAGYCYFTGTFAPANSNYAFRSWAWKKADGMDTSYTTCEDHEFFSRISKLGKVVFNPKMVVYTSARRMKKMGYLKFLTFQLENSKKFYSKGECAKEYENIR